MFHVVLFQPEIPPNTGNIIRLCANCGAQLHLIRPLGFDMSNKQLRRAGLDYHEFADVQVYDDLDAFIQAVKPTRLLACSTKGRQNYTELRYQTGDAFLFGPETRGLPDDILNALPNEQLLRIPMLPDNRSLNLSNATAIIIYEAWRQQGFTGAVAT
ncbi:MAG: tRNA (uridine(34)/cytosine(34)/5-carboxymethylaminomethyluridine(34)-2'-O)-methyltransferase TrmL [Ectothiorhodospiraceae bacterium]|nr:tRNA (uridine(34)/cytosine(34)/5-carboxymethylaminomethyluridine(34)-2'-O)-methyltransferase TrmL [Ectothiorhodospiraceae bacterium]